MNKTYRKIEEKRNRDKERKEIEMERDRVERESLGEKR